MAPTQLHSSTPALKASSPALSQTSSLCPVSSLPAKTSPLQNPTMVSGSAPLTDSQSLLHSVSKRFDIEEMGSRLYVNWFNIEACCVTMLPSRKKGESLVLPNLKLKVIIEAIRALTAVVLYCYILAPQTPKACCSSGAKSKKISSIATLQMCTVHES